MASDAVYQIGFFGSRNEESIGANAILNSGLTFNIITKCKADETGFKITKEESSLVRDSAGTSYTSVGWIRLRCYADAQSYDEIFYVVRNARYNVMLSPSSSLYREILSRRPGVRTITSFRKLTPEQQLMQDKFIREQDERRKQETEELEILEEQELQQQYLRQEKQKRSQPADTKTT